MTVCRPAWLGLLGATLALQLSTIPAAAQSAKDKREAQKLLLEGNKLASEGDYVAALERFKEAYAQYPSHKILINIGTTLRQLGRNVEAAQAYEDYLNDPKADAARSKEIKRLLEEIDAAVGRIQIEVKGGLAEVRLDGKPIENFDNGMSMRVEPGEHTVVAESEGFVPAVKTLKVAAREEKQVELELRRPEKPRPVVIRPPPTTSAQKPVGWVVGGLGVAGIGMGGIFGLLAKSDNDEATLHCLNGGKACDQEGISLGESAQTKATISTVSIVVGGAALAAGIVLLLTAPSPENSRSSFLQLRIAGGASPWGTHVGMEGVF